MRVRETRQHKNGQRDAAIDACKAQLQVAAKEVHRGSLLEMRSHPNPSDSGATYASFDIDDSEAGREPDSAGLFVSTSRLPDDTKQDTIIVSEKSSFHADWVRTASWSTCRSLQTESPSTSYLPESLSWKIEKQDE